MNADHVPVPSEHAPRKRALGGEVSLTVWEPETPTTWMQTTNTVEVRR